MIEGSRTGKWQEFHENGKLKLVGEYREGKPFGLLSLYFDNGNPKSMTNYSYTGALNSIYHGFYESGKKKVIGRYTNDQPSGDWIYFYPNKDTFKVAQTYHYLGHLSEEKYYPDLNRPTFYQYISRSKTNQIDSLGFFVDGEKTGEWKVYNEMGNLLTKGPYHKGLKEGYWHLYYYGTDEINEGDFEKGQKVGLWKYIKPDHKDIFYDNEEEKLVNYWEGEKQTVKNGKGFIPSEDYETKGNFTHYFLVKKHYKDSLFSHTTRKFVKKVRNEDS